MLIAKIIHQICSLCLQMEQIKRVNRLLTTDNIFIRQYLLIPVEAESLDAIGGHNQKTTRSHSCDIQPEASTSSSGSITSSITSSRSIEPIDADEDSRRDVEDFLSKMDSAIALTKKSVEKTRKQSDFLADNHEYDSSFNDSSSSSERHEQKITYEGAYQSLNRVSSNPDRRHIRNSLHRLQKQQEEMFEL